MSTFIVGRVTSGLVHGNGMIRALVGDSAKDVTKTANTTPTRATGIANNWCTISAAGADYVTGGSTCVGPCFTRPHGCICVYKKKEWFHSPPQEPPSCQCSYSLLPTLQEVFHSPVENATEEERGADSGKWKGAFKPVARSWQMVLVEWNAFRHASAGHELPADDNVLSPS
uniref:Uncharacterized protein TCIL3000_11_9140 n=1 Tax=Trypanosoma congolense (strain IL3000) TaxID=1068625 RepID=G0V1D5_TRYCI|nr:unnamed protein product [Trypanosoma congolense IL3000]